MLYKFDKLRTLIDKIAPSRAEIRKRNLIVEGEDFVESLRKGIVIYRDNGIFFKIGDQEFQRYIYKKYYRITRYGMPKFHFIQCRTVKEYGVSNYYAASKDTVTVIDRDTREVHHNCKLQVCKNCISEARGKVPRDTAAFFRNIDQRTETEVENQATDIYGYTFDWQEVRKNYLETCDNSCESCSIQMEGFDTRYIHIHHKNGNKKQNHFSNLEALCILCHSQVDDTHIQNFETNRIKVELEDFIQKYRSEIEQLNRQRLFLHEMRNLKF